MTEAEWLTSTDPQAMLREATQPFPSHRPQMTPLATDRKLRLFACACCRQPEVWGRLVDDSPCARCSGQGTFLDDKWPDWRTCRDCGGTGRVNRSRRAVETAERYADGLATWEELGAMWTDVEFAPAHVCCWADEASLVKQLITASAVGNVGDWQHMPTPAAQAALLRCIVGNPFRPVSLCGQSMLGKVGGGKPYSEDCPACVRLRTPAVLALAGAAYDDRDWAALPVLADALEEAGCADAALLGHLRGEVWEYNDGGISYWHTDTSGPHLTPDRAAAAHRHARGCWALDLILGKE